MTAPRFAELSARMLRDHLDGSGVDPTPAARDAAIEALRAALVERQRARASKRRWLFGLAVVAAAASVSGAWLVSHRDHAATATTHGRAVERPAPVPAARAEIAVVAHPSGAGVTVLGASGMQPLEEGRRLDRGSRVVAGAEGEALLALSTGTSLLVGRKSDLTVLEHGEEQRFLLGAGQVHASVAKLHDRERFIIDTADAEVEVRGTAFDVSALDGASCGGARTRVMVSEGVVVVRHGGTEARVAAGQSWPAGCASASATQPPVERAAQATARRSPSAPHPVQPHEDPSVLGAQNDLFAQGVAARRRGDATTAVATFDRFLAQWPSSALAENATVERMRALKTLDAARGRDAARAYVTAYPSGFARAEAEAALASAP